MTESRDNNIGIFALRLIIDPTLFGDKKCRYCPRGFSQCQHRTSTAKALQRLGNMS